MKILLATPIYPPEIGGPATYTKELSAHLGAEHEITIITYTDEGPLLPRTRLVTVSKKRTLLLRLAIYTWRTWKVSRDIDVIYVQNAMASGLPVALVSMMRGIPFVLKFVGDEAWERATQRRETSKKLEDFLEHPEGSLRIKLMMLVQGFVLRRAAIVTTPSLYLTEELIKAYGVKRANTVVNYNAAENTDEASLLGNRIKNQIVTTARLVAWKGIEGIIRAVAILKKKIPNIKLIVAGDGPELENLKTLATSTGVSENVVFMGNVSREETRRIRKESEVYVLNSTYEGLPHTVLTSFDAMIPTVATDISGTNEAVYHEKTGLLIEPGDDHGLANAIERILNNPELGKTLAQNAKNLLKEKFSWEAHLKTLNEILESVVTKPRN